MLFESESSPRAATGSDWSLPEELEELVRDGDAEAVREILACFQSDTASRLLRLHTAVANSDRTAIRTQAHAIKGSAVQVGAEAVAAVCRVLETDSAHRSAADIGTLLIQVERCFRNVCRAMDLPRQMDKTSA